MPSVLTLSLLAASAQSSSQRIRYVFHEKGGVIGYGSSCNLVLPSPPETPPAELAEIKFEQSRFYVLGKRPDCVYLNEMQGPVHELPAPLKDGSVLLIHGYRFKVSVGQVEKQATNQVANGLIKLQKREICQPCPINGTPMILKWSLPL
ncbi:MAG: hypothetical protein HC848_01740 [Limnobacter sp.]|nr:hypothetical protein [Limnobacter sp.]